MTSHVHQRRSSKDAAAADDNGEPSGIRTASAPTMSRPALQRPLSVTTTTNGHSRVRSISAHVPLPPSLLSNTSVLQSSYSLPQMDPQRRTNHSHTRIHSRNLSLYFPQSSLTTSTISELEDGSQEISIPHQQIEKPNGHGSFHARKPLTPLGQGFTFGSKPPPSTVGIGPPLPTPPVPTGTPSSLNVTRPRRGHHHKHSLSHNFFSFLEPGSTLQPSSSASSSSSPNPEPELQLHTQPTPNPVSSRWGTGLDRSVSASSTSNSPSSISRSQTPPLTYSPPSQTLLKSLTLTTLTLGTALWIKGQQSGSLACTGLGYWVVFDAIGVGMRAQWPFSRPGIRDKKKIRRPYGNPRLSTVFTFAQSVYLMFSAVYVCKETLEHVLLSSGDETDGHHHHAGDQVIGTGLEIPLILTTLTFFILLTNAILVNSSAELMNVTQTHIPSPQDVFRTIERYFVIRYYPSYLSTQTPSKNSIDLLSNPYIISPLSFCIGLVLIGTFIDASHQRISDLILASLIALITFNLACKACVVFGRVLLQTSPSSSSHSASGNGGRTDANLDGLFRALKEIERHPQVTHVPRPHIWQIAPSFSSSSSFSFSPSSGGGTSTYYPPSQPITHLKNLVITLNLHVKPETSDEDVLELTRWAWDRIVVGLGGAVSRGGAGSGGAGNGNGHAHNCKVGWGDEADEDEGPEVTVGISRG